MIVAHAGNTVATAQVVGPLTGQIICDDSLTPSRTNEYYKFSIDKTETVALALTKLTADANLQLGRDINGDGIIESSEVIATSAHTGLAQESIGKTLSPGTYYARVYQGSGNANYTLTFSESTVSQAPPPMSGLHIVFDYTYDTSGFFASHPQAEALLKQAATAFSRFTNKLSAIVPGNGNTWTESFFNPNGSNTTITINNQTVAANTLVIYVGGSSQLVTRELGMGGPGGWYASGSQSWLNTVSVRGQTGALKTMPTGFGPWGGAITLSTTANWNLSTAAPKSGQDDFLSVATHEIAHVLGFGTSASWKADVFGNTFVGAHAKAANHGLAVPLSAGLAHWANAFVSTANGVSQPCEMDPILTTGTRRAFTLLDYAGLEDVGWTVS